MPKNAIDLLIEDHETIRALLKKLTDTTEGAEKTRLELAQKIATELDAHTTIEEELFYPAFKDAAEKKEDVDLYYEANEEHHVAKTTLGELLGEDPTTPEFSAKATVLEELIEHHAKEEEKEMFPAARRVMDEALLQQLGILMEERKRQLLAA